MTMGRLTVLSFLIVCGFLLWTVPATAAEPALQIKKIGGYYVGGKEVVLSGLPVVEKSFTQGGPIRKVDPNGEFEAGQMYVQFVQLAKPKAKYPLLLWHGGGLSGSTWENTPDGREGWQMFFLRQGHDVYVSDAVERGRASWARFPEINSSDPIFRSKLEAWEGFRIGPKYSADKTKREAFPGTQFPTEAFDQFTKQSIPRWVTSDPMTQAAYNTYIASFTKGSVPLVHSQAGNFAIQAALANRQNVKALVLIEPSGTPNPEKTDLTPLKDLPQLFIWGDNIDKSPSWTAYNANVRKYYEALKKMDAPVTWIDLPAMGIKGNSHMIYMDKNSDQVAKIVQDWLTKQGLMQPAKK